GSNDTTRAGIEIVESDEAPEPFAFETGQVNNLSDTIVLCLGQRFFEAQIVRYDVTSGTAVRGLTDGGFYYVSFGDAAFDSESEMLGVKLYDNAALSGDAINIFKDGALTDGHTLTGVESFTVDAGNDIALDVRALVRTDLDAQNSDAATYIINVDRIAAGDDMDVWLRPSYLQTGAGESGGVIVKHRTDKI